MAKLGAALLVGAAIFGFGSAAMAADLLPPPPPPEPYPAPIEASGWYLRGDVGFGVSSLPTGLAISPDPIANGVGSGFLSTSATNTFSNSTLSGSEFFDFGVGYQYNPWLRGDITGELRGGSHFQSLETINDPAFPAGGSAQFADFYRGDVSTYLLMANIYADLGTWSGISPYVGAGIGYGVTNISGLTDQGVALGGPVGGFFGNGSQGGFAWSLMTGLDFHVTPNLTMELGYRYLSYEGFKSGGSSCLNGTGLNGGFSSGNCGGAVPNVLSSARLGTNDFLLGFRWMIGDVAPPPAPLVRRY
jgi:opacity protein-like surface antigen